MIGSTGVGKTTIVVSTLLEILLLQILLITACGATFSRFQPFLRFYGILTAEGCKKGICIRYVSTLLEILQGFLSAAASGAAKVSTLLEILRAPIVLAPGIPRPSPRVSTLLEILLLGPLPVLPRKRLTSFNPS